MPFEDERFGAVASNFGFLHFPYPEVALAETARVGFPGRPAGNSPSPPGRTTRATGR